MLVLYLVCLVVCLLCGIPALMYVNNHDSHWITYGDIILYALASIIPIVNILFTMIAVTAAVAEGIHWGVILYDKSEFMNKEVFKRKEK